MNEEKQKKIVAPLKTYILQFILENGNGWAFVNAYTINHAQSIFKTQTKYSNAKVISVKETKYYGQNMQLVYEGAVTTVSTPTNNSEVTIVDVDYDLIYAEIDSKLSNYFTKDEIKDLLKDIDVSVDLSNYYTKSAINTMVDEINNRIDNLPSQSPQESTMWTIGEDGYWYLNGAKTDHYSKGADGANGTNGTNGTNGANGADGTDGLSAYEIAVRNGFQGDESAWLLSLHGKDGVNGEDGDSGSNGDDGISITGVTAQYGSSANANVEPSTWGTSVISATSEVPYVWMRLKITYSEGSPTYTSPTIVDKYTVSTIIYSGGSGGSGGSILGSGNFNTAYNAAKQLDYDSTNDQWIANQVTLFAWLLEDVDENDDPFKKVIWHTGQGRFIDALGDDIIGEITGLSAII